MKQPLVMKFGGAAVATPQHFSRIAEIIVERAQREQPCVVVVSAMGDTTDQLIALAQQVNPNPPKREYDMLVTVGERVSISLLAMALAARDCEAVSFTGSQSGIITSSHHSEAHIIDVKPLRIQETLERGKVAIVAGFQGVSREKEITTLGRGGSDTTAVALAVALEAKRVEFYKDVPGIFDGDPKEKPDASHLEILSYDEALAILAEGSEVLAERCVELAKRHSVPLQVRSFVREKVGCTFIR